MKKRHIFLVLIAVVSLAFFWLDAGNFTRNIVENSPRNVNLNSNTTKKDVSAASSLASNDLPQVANDLSNPMGDQATAEEIKGWFASRGNYNFLGLDYLSDYRAYDMDTLTRLSESGDLKSMHVMAERLSSFNEVKAILLKAALHGSTEALIEIGAMNENGEGNLNNLPSAKEKRKNNRVFCLL